MKEADLGNNLNDFGNKRKEKAEKIHPHEHFGAFNCFRVAKCMHI